MAPRRRGLRGLRTLVLGATAFAVSGCDSPLVRELAPGAVRFGVVASREIRLTEGSRHALEVRVRSSGKHIVLLRLAEGSDWVLALEAAEIRLQLRIEQEPGRAQSVLISKLDRYSDSNSKGYVLRFFDVPRDLEVERWGRIVLEVLELPRSAPSTSLSETLEVRKISDL